MRCKSCMKVVRHPRSQTRILQLCGTCRICYISQKEVSIREKEK